MNGATIALTGPDQRAAFRAATFADVLRSRGVEVLLLADRIDEWVMGQVTEFEGKRFKEASRGDLELGGLADQAERARIDEERKENKALLKRFKDALGDRVLEVRVSERLRDSPALLVHGEGELSAQMRMSAMQATSQPSPIAAPFTAAMHGTSSP